MTQFTYRLLTAVLLFTLTISAQNIPIRFSNNDFEAAAGNGSPINWKIDSQAKIFIDNVNAHGGSSSLLVNHDVWTKTKISSEEVTLKVGRVYKLSGWVKTEGAITNPIDQYPTSVAACLTMESFPFTNSTITAGGTNTWQKIEGMFVAIKSHDKIQLHLGYNGNAFGKAWFDDIELEEVTDISQYIPMETVRWHGPAFRYEDKGWIFVHIEGKPYQRGYQYGSLLADEIKMFIEKLAINDNTSDPAAAWSQRRVSTDALLLRKYEEEYLTEMKGIADGAAKSGAKVFDRPVDFLDIVSINSAIDLDYMGGALRVTPNPLTGKSFLANEDDLSIPERLHKCSSFLANNSATKDGKIVFGQLFMWGAYTGYHWNVICDVVPSEGNRLVYETFPGGIHSGADFYMNSAGIMMGETTVQQTPFNPDGIPQSNRIRKAAQYANSIDDVVKIMTTKNNGMYTNDWLIGDVKKNEIAILVLGTNKYRVWRSSKNDWYNNAKDFYWSDNNNKDLEVRKEYIVNPDNAPNDLVWRPVNRDIAFWNYYQQDKGNIDHQWGIKILGSSPINRPHACDGKITTSEMAEQLVFLAHNGKVTLREQIVGENGRMPDLPNAYSRLTLGYATLSPIYVVEKMREMRNKPTSPAKVSTPVNNFSEVKDVYSFDKDALWKGTVYPASEKENWFVSGTASYYNLLKQAPAEPERAFSYMKDELTELNYRLLYIMAKEGTIAPLDVKTIYDKYNNYQIPRIKATYLLHQLRLLLGNKTFSVFMNKIHDEYKEKNVTTESILASLDMLSGKQLKEFAMQWLDRDDLPDLIFSANTEQTADAWKLKLNIKQAGKPYNFFTTVVVDLAKERIVKVVEVKNADQTIELTFKDKPANVIFNYGNDIPVQRDKYFTYQNFFDDFSTSLIVYGTTQQIEANHTIALRYQKMVADRFTEVFQPIKKDSEVAGSDLINNDLIILGGASDNSLTKNILDRIGIVNGKYFFKWMGTAYSSADDGLYATFPNPYNPQKAVYLFTANSAQQLMQMTKRHQTAPAWALFKGDKITKKGYYAPEGFEQTIN